MVGKLHLIGANIIINKRDTRKEAPRDKHNDK